MHDDSRATFERIIKASQANFDHLSGEHQANARVFNQAMVQMQDIMNDMLARMTYLEQRIAAME